MGTLMNDNQSIIATVIPWELGEWGIAIDLPIGNRIAYSIGSGSRTDAENEQRRIAEANPPIWGPWAGRDLKRHGTL